MFLARMGLVLVALSSASNSKSSDEAYNRDYDLLRELLFAEI